MTKTDIAKKIAKPVVAWSTSSVIGAIVRNNTNPQSKLQEAEVMVAAVVIGYMVAEKSEETVCRMIDSVVSLWNDNFAKKA